MSKGDDDGQAAPPVVSVTAIMSALDYRARHFHDERRLCPPRDLRVGVPAEPAMASGMPGNDTTCATDDNVRDEISMPTGAKWDEDAERIFYASMSTGCMDSSGLSTGTDACCWPHEHHCHWHQRSAERSMVTWTTTRAQGQHAAYADTRVARHASFHLAQCSADAVTAVPIMAAAPKCVQGGKPTEHPACGSKRTRTIRSDSSGAPSISSRTPMAQGAPSIAFAGASNISPEEEALYAEIDALFVE